MFRIQPKLPKITRKSRRHKSSQIITNRPFDWILQWLKSITGFFNSWIFLGVWDFSMIFQSWGSMEWFFNLQVPAWRLSIPDFYRFLPRFPQIFRVPGWASEGLSLDLHRSGPGCHGVGRLHLLGGAHGDGAGAGDGDFWGWRGGRSLPGLVNIQKAIENGDL